MPSIIVGIFVGLTFYYRKQAIREKERRQEAEWNSYEDFREEHGYVNNREKMPKHKPRAPRKKHRY